MKRSLLACLALVSLGSAWRPGVEAARPRYGGTLRAEVQAAWVTLDPAAWPSDPVGAADASRLIPLVFETLVRLDADGRLAPGLAVSWQKDARATRWVFHLRAGVRLHDGGLLDASKAAAALRRLPAGCSASDEAGDLVIRASEGAEELDWEMADPRQAIGWAGPGGLVGTGPFKPERWVQGTAGVLRAHEGYWGGRPFLDAVKIEFGRRPREQVSDLEQGRADLALVLPQDTRRLGQRGIRIAAAAPRELVALVFDTTQPVGANADVRRALSMSIDRAAICSVLLQRQGQPAHALLPQALSGYAFLMPGHEDRAAARTIVRGVPPVARTLRAYADPADTVATAVAGRVAADAREAGLGVVLSAVRGGALDARFVRRPLTASGPDRALADLASGLGFSDRRDALVEDQDAAGASPIEGDARFEVALVARHLVVPLVHLPQLYGLSPATVTAGGASSVADGAGGWCLQDVWLRPE